MFGNNVHAQSLSGSQKAEHLAYVRRLKPWAELVMDDPKHVVAVKQAIPDSIVVFRDNDRGGNNNAFHTHRPFDVVNGYRWCADHDIIAYIGNEDAWNAANMQWQTQVAQYANDVGLECCFVNGGPGQPQPHELAKGHIDPLIVACTHHHYMGMHEYAPWDLSATNNDLIGRHRLMEARRLHIWDNMPPSNRRWILVTEFGFDIINGQGHPLIPLIEYFRHIGITDPEQHIFDLIYWTAENLYIPGPIAGAMWYCYGAVPSPFDRDYPGQHWDQYNILRVPKLMELLVNATWPLSETLPMYDLNDNRWISVLIRSTASSTNVRTGPSITYPRVASIPSTPIAARVMPAQMERRWLPIALLVDGTIRTDLWVHRDYVIETDPAPTFTGIPLPDVHLNVDERRKMAQIFDWLSAVFRNEDNWDA